MGERGEGNDDGVEGRCKRGEGIGGESATKVVEILRQEDSQLLETAKEAERLTESSPANDMNGAGSLLGRFT